MSVLSDGVPGPLWLGREAGQWPIQAWESEVHALAWCRESPNRRRVWLVVVAEAVEHRVVEVEAHLAPMEPVAKATEEAS